MNGLREVVARAIANADLGRNWEASTLSFADAALSAIRAAGFAVVPVEPTEAMLKAGGNAYYGEGPGDTQAECIYAAMLTAALSETAV